MVHGGGSWCDEHKRAPVGTFSDPNRGSRHERGYGSKWDRIRPRIIARDNNCCQACLADGRVTLVGHKPYTAYVDHITPKAEGGTDDDDNLQTLCRACHTTKTGAEAKRGRGAG